MFLKRFLIIAELSSIERFILLSVLLLTSGFLSQAMDAATSSSSLCVVTGVEDWEVLYIRAEPNPRSAQVGSIPHDGKSVLKLGPVSHFREYDWFKIRYGTVTGWVNSKYLICRLSPEEAKKIVANRSRQLILSLRDRDMGRFSKYVHPNKGVRFSPYGYVEIKRDLVFSAKEITGLFGDKKKHCWGDYDGSGERIYLTFASYYERFVYDHDFANAQQVGYNSIIGTGNTRNNNFEVYPHAIVVEYHFPGFDPQYHGIDWSSLRLVFEELDGEWYLVGVVHDEWTI